MIKLHDKNTFNTNLYFVLILFSFQSNAYQTSLKMQTILLLKKIQLTMNYVHALTKKTVHTYGTWTWYKSMELFKVCLELWYIYICTS